MSVEYSVGIFFGRNIITKNDFKTILTVGQQPHERRAGVVSFVYGVDNTDLFVRIRLPSFDDFGTEFANGITVIPRHSDGGIIPVENRNFYIRIFFSRKFIKRSSLMHWHFVSSALIMLVIEYRAAYNR